MAFSHKITVFTPTYNRAYILENLYRSLQRQSFTDFEWLVVDDGSSDGTKALLERWQKEDNPFPIRYCYKENGGKCRAINYGLKLAQGELFFTVDSDDYLTDDALEKVALWESALPKDQKFCGIVANGGHSPTETPNTRFEEAYLDGNLEAFGRKWEELPLAKRDQIGRTVDHVAGRNRYIGYLISLGMYSFKGVKVGLDCANGSSWNIAKCVFDALGAKTYVINAAPDGYNINQNAGSTHIEVLQRYVVENGLDVGFAYDGDADRCLCVDEKGNIVTGDHILYIYGKYMKERGKLLGNTVVTTIMSNFGLYKAFDELGIGYAKTKVGDKYVYEYMMANGCRLGGEQSGHIIFSKYASTGDGILTSLKIMETMMAKKKTLSQLCEGFTFYPQVLKNVRVADKAAAQADPDVQKAVAEVTAKLGDTGRILVRESGTEPVIRVMVEAESKDVCEQYVDSVIEVIRAKGHCV